jgi:mevalonate kinase
MFMEFYSHGKLMLSGEYAVLNGATCFALPTKMGQKMTVDFKADLLQHAIVWRSFDVHQKEWFYAKISLPNNY